jgi:hypothetical protein
MASRQFVMDPIISEGFTVSQYLFILKPRYNKHFFVKQLSHRQNRLSTSISYHNMKIRGRNSLSVIAKIGMEDRAKDKGRSTKVVGGPLYSYSTIFVLALRLKFLIRSFLFRFFLKTFIFAFWLYTLFGVFLI